MDLQSIKGAAFDLDGTLYLGDELIEGAGDVISFFRGNNIKICFFTNSSVRTRKHTRSKLERLGIKVGIEDEVFTSAYATAVYAREKGIKKCYCIGTEGLIKELRDQDIEITGENGGTEKSEAIIIGLDPDFNYHKLEMALNIYLLNKCPLIACNLDKSFPVENIRMKPGTGSIAAALANAANRGVEDVGKPNTYMLEMLAKRWGMKPREILVVGDSPESDIAMAVKFDSPSILISAENKMTYKNSISVNNISKIINLFPSFKKNNGQSS